MYLYLNRKAGNFYAAAKFMKDKLLEVKPKNDGWWEKLDGSKRV